MIVESGSFGKNLINQIRKNMERGEELHDRGEKINIFGASGHAKVILDCIRSHSNFEIGYVFDDDSTIRNIQGIQMSRENELNKFKEHPFLVAIGDNRNRKEKVKQLAKNHQFSSAVMHSSSIVSSFCKIGNGTVLMPFACINSDTSIGEHVIINTGAVVEHNCRIENFAHISPNASLAGGVEVLEGAHVGIGAQVIQGVTIGKWASIGAGAVIIKDVPGGATAVGVPGRVL